MIRLGGDDWRHDAWRGVFYPEDLPEDWQLTFYANAFDAVGLVPEAWLTPALDELAGWVEDTREGFCFYPELPSWPVTDLQARLEILAPRLGALLAIPGCAEEVLALAQHLAPVWAKGPMAGLPEVAHDFVQACMPERAPLVVLEADSVDLRAARQAMDALGPRQGVILVQEVGRRLEILHRLSNLRNLLGWQ